MDRVVEPELSDHLPAADPRMLRVRRDLRRVNTVMGNPGIIARELLRLPATTQPRRLWELGCGDGLLLLDVARRLPRAWGPVEAILVDQKNSVRAETVAAFQTLGWSIRFETADIFAWLQRQSPEARTDVITANMFLHHFPGDRLSELLHLAAAHTQAFIACEPRRFRRAVVSCHLLWFLGCSKITRHDALASVRAGFQADELTRLWPQHQGWQLRETLANYGSHLFVATR